MYNIIIKIKGKISWKQSQSQKMLGEFAPSQEQVEKCTEMAHNNPKEAYKEVMVFGRSAQEKMVENKGVNYGNQ